LRRRDKMDNEEKTYRDLQKHLDTLPVGYPATQSGAEIRILKQLFTPEEAMIATKLSIKPEPVTHVYESVRESGMSLEELQDYLDSMEKKFCITTGTMGDEKCYSNSMFVVGIYEGQVNRLTPEFLKDMAQYVQEAFGRELFRVKTPPQMRTIPVEKSIAMPDKYPVSSYDSVRELITNNTGQFAVANCICRQVRDLTGERCKLTDLRETCLILNGDQYITAGLGRPITRGEALDILEKAQEVGLVLQPINTQQPWAICCCCGDCCGILRNIKQFPRPADYYASNYYAEIDSELCQVCQKCIERCQLDARSLSNGVVSINLDRCIGCGNCVAVCESGASHLKKKEEETVPPEDLPELLQKIGTEKAAQ
jgi:electron transport complex protein RnfB